MREPPGYLWRGWEKTLPRLDRQKRRRQLQYGIRPFQSLPGARIWLRSRVAWFTSWGRRFRTIERGESRGMTCRNTITHFLWSSLNRWGILLREMESHFSLLPISRLRPFLRKQPQRIFDSLRCAAAAQDDNSFFQHEFVGGSRTV